jgi:4'-phosphopantetheinyl transferase
MSATFPSADVWVVDLDKLSATELELCSSILSPAEKNRMRRFLFKQDHDSYCAAHALTRLALTSFEPDIPPQAWVFEDSRHGRPEISTAHDLPRLRFNISHTRQVVACIVTRGLDCGVDVELHHRSADLELMARTTLAPSELATFTAAPGSERAALFCRYWTLKEAFAKALGVGLLLEFDRTAFVLLEGSARLCSSSEEWSFEQWSPTPTHTIATAIRSCRPVQVIRHSGLPIQRRLHSGLEVRSAKTFGPFGLGSF